MTPDSKHQWLADLWDSQSAARTRAMGVLSSPNDSALFADAMLTEFEKRFNFKIDEPKEPTE